MELSISSLKSHSFLLLEESIFFVLDGVVFRVHKCFWHFHSQILDSLYTVSTQSPHLRRQGGLESFYSNILDTNLHSDRLLRKQRRVFPERKHTQIHQQESIYALESGKNLALLGYDYVYVAKCVRHTIPPLSLENLIHSRLDGVVVFICFENYFSHQIKLIYSKIDLILKIQVTLPQSIFSYAKYTHDI